MVESERTLRESLESSPYCKGLEVEALETLLECAHEETYAKGRFLFHEGSAANSFYLIQDGLIGLELDCPNRKDLSIQTLSAGDAVGWSWLIPPYKWRFDARALEASRVITLDAVVLREECAIDSHLGYALLERVAQVQAERLDAARLQLLDLYGNPEEGKHVERSRIG